MKKMVLIITNTADRTVDYICDNYKNVDFKRLNVDKFSEYRITIDNLTGWTIIDEKWDKPLTAKDVFSIYYRKPALPALNIYKEEYQIMIGKDIMAIIEGIVNSFQGKVLTKPAILRKCENKIFQLLYAQKHFKNIPRSTIGNDCGTMLGSNSVIKPISVGKIYLGSKCEIFQTCLFDGDFSEDISLTPLYLQEYVCKQYEVRVTVIDKEFFSVKIESTDKVDWRSHDAVNKYTIIDIPDSIKTQCLELLDNFELIFGAFDYIVNPNDEWIFLEVNPNGQWQWLEYELGLKISNSIVNYLTR